MRVVSLVPSFTETLFALGLGPDELVGRSSFCIEPAGRVDAIRRVGGTKTPNLRRIVELAPELVLMDRDENRREDHDALLAAGLRVEHVELRDPGEVPALLEALGAWTGRGERARALADEARAALERAGASRALEGARALILCWRDPLIAVAPQTYGGGLLRLLGATLPSPGEGRYPPLDAARIAELGVERVLLPSEPYAFGEGDAREIEAEVAAAAGAAGHESAPVRATCCDGQDLFWYGARTAGALARLADALR